MHPHTRIIFRWANYLHMGRCANLNLLNKANIVLIPKKDGADSVTDYKPISLIHSFAKIISKILALLLAPKMHELISPCQSAFIKGRSVHDNFLYVRNRKALPPKRDTLPTCEARHLKGLRLGTLGLSTLLDAT